MPFFSKNSKAISSDEIRIELIELLSNQLSQNSNLKELLLWINETNCYVSCHWYDSKNGIIDDSDNYSVVVFDEFQDMEYEETESFYEKMCKPAWVFDTRSVVPKNIKNSSKLNFWQLGSA